MTYNTKNPQMLMVVSALEGTSCSKLSDAQDIIQKEIDLCTEEIAYINNHQSDTHSTLLKKRLEEIKAFYQRIKTMITNRKTALSC